MIRLDNVSKQVGHQILFIEASAALQKGEKIGLVGPNGAGKTTLFRMISGQELPDERHSLQKVFAVIQDQQQLAVGQRGLETSSDFGQMDSPARIFAPRLAPPFPGG